MKIRVGTLMEMAELLRSGKKITAIKLIREKTGTDLKKAKEFVDIIALPLSEWAFGSLDMLNRDVVIDASPVSEVPRLLIDEELIFDPDLAAECPIEKDCLTKTEQSEVVSAVLEGIIEGLRSSTEAAIRQVLYRRFMDLDEGVREETLAMMNDKFFHV